MSILLRGDHLQRARLASGLVLFVFLLTHLLNHALGLVSIDAMLTMQGWRKAITRSWPGTVILATAFAVHIALALVRIAGRRTWRMRPWEATQLLSGIAIPLLLIQHVVYNRGAASLAGTDDNYVYELANIWPGLAVEHIVLVLLAWGHVVIGLHHWLRLTPDYARVQAPLLALAVLVPFAAIAGFTVSGRQVAALMSAEGAFDRLLDVSRAPRGEVLATLDSILNNGRLAFLALLGLALAVPLALAVRGAAAAKIRIVYRGGPEVRVAPGATLLEISRRFGVPHASVCGGRARCSTCRVGIQQGHTALPPPTGAEAATLARVGAGPGIRLACQIRPKGDLIVLRLVPPDRARIGEGPASRGGQGVERTMAVLFLDARGFTALAENRLPYDVVFILNRLFAEVGEAISAEGGTIDKYMGDGLMALFGARGESDPAAACRAALKAVRGIDLALDRLNRDMAGELGQPLRLGIGIEVGPLVMGHIGHPQSAALTVIGSTVNTAARFEALTKEMGCQVIASEAVLRTAGVVDHGFPRRSVAIRGLGEERQVVLIPRGREVPLIG